MSAYDPNFELKLSPDLYRGADASDAIRAGLALPVQIRFHGVRMAMFVAAFDNACAPAMRESACAGLDRAMAGYRAIRDLLCGWEEVADLHPALPGLFQRIEPDRRDVRAALDGFLDHVASFRAIGERGDRLQPEDYDRLLHTAYTTFHPAMMDLSTRMAEAGVDLRREAADRARAAEQRTVEARTRIERIARTVGMISLNAQVEAARAGTSGRAFAVIAEEIKALSEQTAEATAQMRDGVDDMMEAMRLS